MAGDGAGTDGHERTNLNILRTKRAGNDWLTLAGLGGLNPFDAIGQGLVEESVNLDDCGDRGRASPEPALINPALNSNVRYCLLLEVALFGVATLLAEVEGPLDVDGMRVVAFDQIGIVAVHLPREAGQRLDQALGKSVTPRRVG